MALFALPNPTKEVTVKFPIEKVKVSIKEVITAFKDYKLLEEDNITNRFRILVMQTDGLSMITLDMGQHLDITLNEISETTTKINFEVSRVIGVIDKQFEASRATKSINTFITLFSKSLEGKLKELVEQKRETQKQQAVKGNSTHKLLWAIIIISIIAMVIAVMKIRSENGL